VRDELLDDTRFTPVYAVGLPAIRRDRPAGVTAITVTVMLVTSRVLKVSIPWHRLIITSPGTSMGAMGSWSKLMICEVLIR